MAENARADLLHELESLRMRLQRKDAALAKHRLVAEDLQQANARLEADIQQLQVELQKCRAEQAARDPAHEARLQLLGELAAGFAHELNQPLTAITTYAHAALELLEPGKFAEKEVTSLLERLAGQAARAGELIRRMRRFATRGSAEKTPVNINDVVREALLLIEIELREQRVQTRLKVAESIPSIPADPVQLSQVLLNLIRNAIEAMHSNPADQRVLTITTRRTATDLEVSVSDTGAGISTENVRKVFKAFHTTKPNGMGLGLPICRAIVQAHNGRLWVKSNPRRGTTFFFALPLSKP